MAASKSKAKAKAKAKAAKEAKVAEEMKTQTPTQEEVQIAENILAEADPKEMRSLMATMVYHLKKEGKASTSILDSRDEERKEWRRHKDSKKTTTTKQSVVSVTKSGHKKGWWSQEEMDKTIGEKKGKTLRESGKIGWRPCQKTGSVEAHRIEWRREEEVDETMDVDENRLDVSGEMDGDKDDMSLLGLDKTEGKSLVKTEPETEMSKMKVKIDSFHTNADKHLQKTQQDLLDVKRVNNKILSSKTKAKIPRRAEEGR